jgi:hypothetical protein
MKTINHLGATGSTAYNHQLMLAAHFGASKRVRYAVWMVPAGGAGRGIAESDPRHRAAVKRSEELGRSRWTDEEGTLWSVQEN